MGAGGTGHRESVQVLYDPAKVSYDTLLDVYWHQIDPTTDDRMFLDTGLQYSSAIFVDGPQQRRAAGGAYRYRAHDSVPSLTFFSTRLKTRLLNSASSSGDVDGLWVKIDCHACP